MRLGIALTTALALAACVGGAEEMPAGDPPKMGDMTGTMGGTPVAWETFDFSVGAYDASAWADADWETKVVMAHLMGYSPGKPKEMTGRVFVEGTFGTALRTGAATAVVISVLKGQDFDGPRLSSDGQQASFVIESIGPKVAQSYSRRVTGRVEARLCPVDWPGQACQDVSLRFDTDMQMESTLAVTP